MFSKMFTNFFFFFLKFFFAISEVFTKNVELNSAKFEKWANEKVNSEEKFVNM